MIAYQATSLFDPIAEAYDGWYDTPEGDAIFREEVLCLRHLGDDYFGRWLEVGVGTGRFAKALGIGHGIDVSQQMAAIAKRRGVEVQVGSATQLPFPDGAFDGVLLALTLCFVVDPGQALRECARILRDSGRLVIGMVPANSPWGVWYRQKKAEGHPIYSHAHFYTVAETLHLAEKENFIFRKSCSTLFRNPEKPPSDPPEIVPGIRAEAGFVGLLFTSPLPPSSF
jgi:ubiquinone/menaquinone biosynthesis C-methylase UbiE